MMKSLLLVVLMTASFAFACPEFDQPFTVDFLKSTKLSANSAGLRVDDDRLFYDNGLDTWIVTPKEGGAVIYFDKEDHLWRTHTVAGTADKWEESFKGFRTLYSKGQLLKTRDKKVDLSIKDSAGTKDLATIVVKNADLGKPGELELVEITAAGSKHPARKLAFQSSTIIEEFGDKAIPYMGTQVLQADNGFGMGATLRISKTTVTRGAEKAEAGTRGINLSSSASDYDSDGCGGAKAKAPTGAKAKSSH